MKFHPMLLVLPLVGAFLAGMGCAGTSNLTPKVAKALDVFECQLDAVQEFVPHAGLAEEVVNAARSGNVEYAVGLLVQLGMRMDEVQAVSEAFLACSGPVPAEPEPAPELLPTRLESW